MKIYIDTDERYPHYYFYPDVKNEFELPTEEWYKNYGYYVDISDEEYQRLDRIRNEERELQERLEELKDIEKRKQLEKKIIEASN